MPINPAIQPHSHGHSAYNKNRTECPNRSRKIFLSGWAANERPPSQNKHFDPRITAPAEKTNRAPLPFVSVGCLHTHPADRKNKAGRFTSLSPTLQHMRTTFYAVCLHLMASFCVYLRAIKSRCMHPDLQTRTLSSSQSRKSYRITVQEYRV